MHFYLFIHHCFPRWSNVFTIASRIMHELSKTDPELYNHLNRIANIRTKICQKVHRNKHLSTRLFRILFLGFHS